MPISLIESSSNIVLIAHKNPDADSLGAACAFYSYLIRLQKKVTLFCVSKNINPNLAFLPWFDKLTDRFPDDAECMISFDCGSYGRLGIEKEIPLINVDHHLSNNFFGDVNMINTSALSTTEVVYDFFVANDIKINGKIALSLYAGLVDDTHCFRTPECSVKTFEMARRLLQSGADHSICIEWLYERRSLSSIRVRGELLKNMKLMANARLAVFHVSLRLLEETGATIFECKKVLDEALGMRHTRAAIMVLEHPRSGLKISLRTDGTVNAAAILGRFGGGGHLKRSGARLRYEDASQVDAIINIIMKEFM